MCCFSPFFVCTPFCWAGEIWRVGVVHLARVLRVMTKKVVNFLRKKCTPKKILAIYAYEFAHLWKSPAGAHVYSVKLFKEQTKRHRQEKRHSASCWHAVWILSATITSRRHWTIAVSRTLNEKHDNKNTRTALKTETRPKKPAKIFGEKYRWNGIFRTGAKKTIAARQWRENNDTRRYAARRRRICRHTTVICEITRTWALYAAAAAAVNSEVAGQPCSSPATITWT